MDRKLPVWLLTLAAMVPLVLLAWLLMSLASTNAVKHSQPAREDDYNIIYLGQEEKPGETFRQKFQLMDSQESRLQQQRDREFNQISQSTQTQLQDLRTQRDLLKMQKSSF
ncbi:MAG: hypothetical protein PHH75_01450 [Candidatus Omnitrophica bacterium]|nr:hypothetical protein [Candidatus Omnitrophota bacterium]MDD5573824.1 hypothetical protein [Candidatus Omnitrophota bacterium]